MQPSFNRIVMGMTQAASKCGEDAEEKRGIQKGIVQPETFIGTSESDNFPLIISLFAGCRMNWV